LVSFDASDLADGRYTATVAAVPNAGATISEETEATTLDRSLTRWIVDGAAGLAGMVVLVLLGWRGWQTWRAYRVRRRADAERRREREHAFETEETLEAVPVDQDSRDADQGSEPAHPDRIRARFWDEWRDEPVTTGTVLVRRVGAEESSDVRHLDIDEQGRIEVTLSDGRWEIEADAPGFMPATNQVSIPHDGSLDGVRFDLVAIPLKIRRLFESITSMLSTDDLWGTKTPREIERALRDVLRSQTPGMPSKQKMAAAGRGDDAPQASESERQVQNDDQTTQAAQMDDLSDQPSRSEMAEALSERFQAKIAGRQELESAQDYLHALTSLLEEAYYSPRTYGRDVWELARDIGRQLKDRAGADEGGPGS
jgi:hypothetical protein